MYDAPDGDGIERSSFGGQLTVLVPTKVMAFIDGSWLYYTIFERGRRCPIVQRYGAGWYHSHHVDWTAIPQLISDHISAELLRMQPHNERAIEVVRVLVYSSFREDQHVNSEREKMFRALQELNYEVHLGSFTGGQEKCVDISLAVDMLHYATLPQAFDVAVLVSGDRDFIPALMRTRERGKRVAVCSMRNSASLELSDPNAHVKDFDVLWLDDHLDRFIAPVHPDLQSQRPAMLRMLRGVLLDAVAEAGGTVGLLQLRAHLGQVALGPSSALQYISHEFGSLPAFLRRFPHDLSLRRAASGEALVALIASPQLGEGAERGGKRLAARLAEGELLAAAEESEAAHTVQEADDEGNDGDDGLVGLGGEGKAQRQLQQQAAAAAPAAAGEKEEAEELQQQAVAAAAGVAEEEEGASVGEVLRLAEDLLPRPRDHERRGEPAGASRAPGRTRAQRSARDRKQKAALREKLLLLLDTLVEEEKPADEQEDKF